MKRRYPREQAKALQMENDTPTNPEAEVSVATEAEAPEVDTEETLAADEGDVADESGEGDEEFEELDVDGEPLRAPKSLAEKLKARMMMQADYTQKTQALAEQRKAIEADRQAAQWEREMESNLSDETAQLRAVRSRLDQFAQVNWQAVAQQNPGQYAAMHAEFTQLQQYAEGLNGQIEGRKSQLQAAREQATAISIERAVGELNKPDPNIGWDGKFNADRGKELTDFLISVGANPGVLSTIQDPLSIKVINLAFQQYKSLKNATAALKKPAPVAKPVPTVTTGKTRTPVSNPDRLSTENWLKWRESQLAKQARNKP